MQSLWTNAPIAHGLHVNRARMEITTFSAKGSCFNTYFLNNILVHSVIYKVLFPLYLLQPVIWCKWKIFLHYFWILTAMSAAKCNLLFASVHIFQLLQNRFVPAPCASHSPLQLWYREITTRTCCCCSSRHWLLHIPVKWWDNNRTYSFLHSQLNVSSPDVGYFFCLRILNFIYLFVKHSLNQGAGNSNSNLGAASTFTRKRGVRGGRGGGGRKNTFSGEERGTAFPHWHWSPFRMLLAVATHKYCRLIMQVGKGRKKSDRQTSVCTLC